jgi:hypothetical protein
MNIVEEYLKETSQEVDDYYSYCHVLAWKTVRRLKFKKRKSSMLWLEERHEMLQPQVKRYEMAPFWYFHSVVLYEGKVHDVWFGKPLELDDYLSEMFPYDDVRVIRRPWASKFSNEYHWLKRNGDTFVMSKNW